MVSREGGGGAGEWERTREEGVAGEFCGRRAECGGW